MPKAIPEEFRREVIAVAAKARLPCVRIRRTSESPKVACTAGSSSPIVTTESNAAPPRRRGSTSPPSCEKPANGSSCSSKKPRSCVARLPTCPGTSTQNDLPRKREVPPPLVLDLAGDGVPVTVAAGFSDSPLKHSANDGNI
jgi:hypothetical protein